MAAVREDQRRLLQLEVAPSWAEYGCRGTDAVLLFAPAGIAKWYSEEPTCTLAAGAARSGAYWSENADLQQPGGLSWRRRLCACQICPAMRSKRAGVLLSESHSRTHAKVPVNLI